ncbi:substrate-binding domain-containing protein [Streptomyces sp. NPDC046261]|uniref:substrate-binding domain-containing protein n=1 Tax=Streptomyces sp. NPDC046261 TaxID=3157200 RepID=UPI0033CE3EE3
MAGAEQREETNRALLVGVVDYTSKRPLRIAKDLGDITAVRHNVEGLRKALCEGGVFGDDPIKPLYSPGVEQFENRLGYARDHTDGLLLVYFAGHGIVDTRTGGHGRLLLGLRDAKVEHGPGFPGWIRWDDVLNRLCSGEKRPRHTVVVLDCCYAGNASGAWEELDEQDQKRISLLLAVQKNQRIDAGNAERPTPYTAQLIRHLRQGAGASDGAVTLGSLHKGVSEGLRGSKTVGGREWSPLACRKDPADDEILALPAGGDSAGGDGDGGDRPCDLGTDPRPGPDGGPGAGLGRPPNRHRLIAAMLAAAVALALALWWVTSRGPGSVPAASCANHPPLELRVLTDPDLEPVVRKAVDRFVASDANTDDDHCRRTGITVYSAGAAETAEAFRTQYGEWAHVGRSGFNPVGTVGPQPDVWIPASSASARRAQDDGSNQSSVLSLDFDDKRPLAYAPMVLLLPEQLAETESGRTGRPLAELMTAMKGKDAQARVRRADPRSTDGALAAARGLYRTDSPRTIELDQRRQGRPALSGKALVCGLAKGNTAEERAVDRRTAVLVAEPTLGRHQHCAGETGVTRVAEYPNDVPGLDPVFVHVRWNDARLDEEKRERAVQRFRDWLASKDGRKVFQEDGFRDAPQAPFPSPLPGRLTSPGPMPRSLSASEATDTLEKYRQANAASRVRFLLDGSGSMSRWWDGANGAREIVKQSLSRFGPDDVFGVWSVASGGSDTPYRELLAFATHGSWSRTADKKEQEKAAEAGKKVDDATPELSMEADIGGALRAALNQMPRGDEDDGHPQLIVLITDDEDNDRMNAAQQDDLVKFVSDRKVPVVMVSFDSGGCLKGRLGLRVAEASGGTCLDARGDLGKGLDAEISQVAQGHQ